MIGGMTFWVWSITEGVLQSKRSYLEAGGFAEEAITGIRTVKSLNGEEHEADRYKLGVGKAKEVLIKLGKIGGACIGIMWFCEYLTYGISLFSGGLLLKDKRENPVTGNMYTVNEIIITFFSILIGLFT
jgi:ATP-binding cassette subfamily B (MDR/TAP) protein 1